MGLEEKWIKKQIESQSIRGPLRDPKGFRVQGLGVQGLRGLGFREFRWKPLPKGPCTQRVYTLAPKYLDRDYFKAKVYTIWVHGPLGSY